MKLKAQFGSQTSNVIHNCILHSICVYQSKEKAEDRSVLNRNIISNLYFLSWSCVTVEAKRFSRTSLLTFGQCFCISPIGKIGPMFEMFINKLMSRIVESMQTQVVINRRKSFCCCGHAFKTI